MAEQNEKPGGTPAAKARPPLLGAWSAGTLAVLVVLLVAGSLLVRRTEGVMADLPFLHRSGAAQGSLAQQNAVVDQTPWQTATTLAPLAVSQEEMKYAREAEHLADHEVDQAFAAALRLAELQQQQRKLTGRALALQQRVTALEAQVAADQTAVKTLTAKSGADQKATQAAGQAANQAAAKTAQDSEALELAQAQLALDQDELSDERGALARASGDKRGEFQQELQERQADLKKFDASGGEPAVVAVGRYRTLAGLIGAYERQKNRAALLVQAWDAAEGAAPVFAADQQEIAAESTGTGSSAVADEVAALKRRSLQRELMSVYDDRVATEQQLAQVYTKWGAQVGLQEQIVRHLMLEQALWIVAILLAAMLLNLLLRYFTERESLDPRRMRTLSRIGRLAVQALALVGVLLVTFGVPSHLSTAIGLITAGLTVALQDFILAFVGWFLLMGRSGIGVGDIVEINSVTGEVVDIGLFRTTLLETGNWASKGHPTGRRVAFNNMFAVSGQYFNFSTAGQWMWDELTVTLPAGADTNAAMGRVQKAVQDETADDVRLAEAEWRHASKHYDLSQFSAQPAVNVRPSGTGVDLVVRYVTRASVRAERRNKLYQCVLEALRAEPSPVKTKEPG